MARPPKPSGLMAQQRRHHAQEGTAGHVRREAHMHRACHGTDEGHGAGESHPRAGLRAREEDTDRIPLGGHRQECDDQHVEDEPPAQGCVFEPRDLDDTA